jgi:catechol 2,3-dioxygenase-like lactoylglutathione lyase family enzyme
MARGIDHLVVAVHDLDAARENWHRLGFTLAPVARHPFGTANSVVQFQGNYIELLAVADPGAIPEPSVGAFSFAAFNRDFLKKREGLSMIALRSEDARADRADFEAHDLAVFETVDFERIATGPDGVGRKVAFSLAFTREPRLREAGFFTCQHHHAENFWRPEYQRHQNSAERISAVALVTRDPADFHEFMTHVTGEHDMISTSLGVTLDTGEGVIDVVSPVGYHAWYGEETGPDPRRFLAFRLVVGDLDETRRMLEGNGVPFAELAGALVVPPQSANGVAVAFESRTSVGG